MIDTKEALVRLEGYARMLPPNRREYDNADAGLIKNVVAIHNELLERYPAGEDYKNVMRLTPCGTCGGKLYKLTWKQLEDAICAARHWGQKLCEIESYEQWEQLNKMR